MRSVVAVAVLALVSPAVARAADTTLVSRDVSLAGGRTLAAAGPTRFNLVGIHWQGTGSVEFRTRSAAGRWSSWRAAAPEADGPDRGSAENARLRGWTLGNPYWTGTSTRLEVRTRGVVRRVRAHYVWSRPTRVPLRTVSIAQSPAVLPRLAWNANESIRRAPPYYASALEFAVVHHTAGSNTYTREQSAAIVRAIQVYHVQGNGWNDLGYNFLVDKYGQVFEGRYGGVEKNVVGAHAEGFNTGSVGVALIGNYGSAQPSAAAKDALKKVLAWRLDVAHVDPLSALNQISGGNARFPAGIPVSLRAVSGHRDTGFTACPGDSLYSQLGSIARSVSTEGAPKLYEPRVSGAVGGPVRFSARLSAALPWAVLVKDAAGATVAAGSGSGTAIDWTWDASSVTPAPYTYSIEAGPTVRPASGPIGAQAVALTLTSARAMPATLTPNGDGVTDATTIVYTLSTAATVTATLTDPAGNTLAILFSEPRAAGKQSFLFTAEGVIDGTYRIALSAKAPTGKQVNAKLSILVSRTLSKLTLDTPVFSPNTDGRLDSVKFTFELSAPADVKLRILRKGAWVATIFRGRLEQQAHELTWDGKKRGGRLLDGSYQAELTVTDALTTVTQRLELSSDTRPPKLQLVSLARLTFRLDEPAALTLIVNGKRLKHDALKAGAVRVPFPGTPRKLAAVARDAAGNATKPLRFPR